MKTNKVTRIEVIDHTLPAPEGGRCYVKWDENIKVEVMLQDDDRTMKVFITNK